jgi:hypothetical protein
LKHDFDFDANSPATHSKIIETLATIQGNTDHFATITFKTHQFSDATRDSKKDLEMIMCEIPYVLRTNHYKIDLLSTYPVKLSNDQYDMNLVGKVKVHNGMINTDFYKYGKYFDTRIGYPLIAYVVGQKLSRSQFVKWQGNDIEIGSMLSNINENMKTMNANIQKTHKNYKYSHK